MPIYRYRCRAGHDFEHYRQMEDRKKPIVCNRVLRVDGAGRDVRCRKVGQLVPPTSVGVSVPGGTPTHYPGRGR